MKIQTRRSILETWKAVVGYSLREGEWTWGGRDGRNSISDAEQLLTILYPATAIGTLGIDTVDETSDDVLDALRPLGNTLDIPRRLVDILTEYMQTYHDGESPVFAGGTYFGTESSDDIQPGQLRLHVVDAFSMSVSLCLATLGFIQFYRRGLTNARLVKRVDNLQEMTSQRLTAAMVGLLRSFTVNTFDQNEPQGQQLCKMINQRGIANEVLVAGLLDRLQEIRGGLRQELTVGMGQSLEELDNEKRLFECGWTWGVTRGAPTIDYIINIGEQTDGAAESRPYLYFTVSAMDGIQDLFSERTRVLGLLDEGQQRLARSLQLRWDLTRQFWATVATFGDGSQWPLEDMPWVTTDGRESDYYSLLLTSIVIDGARSERFGNIDTDRIGRILEELANRGRITRRATLNDPAVALHLPGMQYRLVGTEGIDDGPLLTWTVSSFTILVLKRLLRVAELLGDKAARLRLLDIADTMWEVHVERRRMNNSEARGLWDEPTQIFEGTDFAVNKEPSWYHTERVIEVLVAASNVTRTRPPASPDLVDRALELIAEAEYLFDQERLRGTNDAGKQMQEQFQVVDAKLRRARSLLAERPGTATMLAGEVLIALDALDAARQDTARMS